MEKLSAMEYRIKHKTLLKMRRKKDVNIRQMEISHSPLTVRVQSAAAFGCRITLDQQD